MTMGERFWAKVDRTAGPEACWVWTASTYWDGYGQFVVTKGVLRRAHRVAYELIVGPIPEGLELDHLCRLKRCVNPRHLEPVTSAENSRRWSDALDTCTNGHPRTAENTYTRKDRFGRQCRVCCRERDRARYAKRRAA